MLSRMTMPGFERTALDVRDDRGLLVVNGTTELGRELGAQLARLCDGEAAARGVDGRCATCAFRHGDHAANGSPATQMDALKCIAEGNVFLCHEEDRACAGWKLMRFEGDARVQVPWEYTGGHG